MELTGRVAIITGAGRGIGRAIALTLAGHGMNVMLAARTESQLIETEQMIRAAGGRALHEITDICNREQVDRLVEHTITMFGRIDVLVNNAAIFQAIGALWETDRDVWWSDFETNLKGPYLCCRAVLPHMIQRNDGVIINLVGAGVLKPLLGGTSYGSSKAALQRMTNTLVAELDKAGYNIHVFSINPGFTKTTMTEKQANCYGGQQWLPQVKRRIDNNDFHPTDEVPTVILALLNNPSTSENCQIIL